MKKEEEEEQNWVREEEERVKEEKDEEEEEEQEELTQVCVLAPHQDLVGLGFADALDVEQLLLGGVGHGLDGVEAGVLQLLDVAAADSTLLHATQHNTTRYTL